MTVLAVTAASNVAQFATSGALARFERTPAELHGQWWRMVTSLLVDYFWAPVGGGNSIAVCGLRGPS